MLEAEAEIAVGETLLRRTAEIVAAVRVLGHRSGDNNEAHAVGLRDWPVAQGGG